VIYVTPRSAEPRFPSGPETHSGLSLRSKFKKNSEKTV
jgi:hypothetical protein